MAKDIQMTPPAPPEAKPEEKKIAAAPSRKEPPRDNRSQARVFTDLDKQALVMQYYTRPAGETNRQFCDKHKLRSGLLNKWQNDPRYAYKHADMTGKPKPKPPVKPRLGPQLTFPIEQPAYRGRPSPTLTVKNKQVNGTYTDEVKQKALQLYIHRKERGMSVADCAHQVGCTADIIYYWARKEGLQKKIPALSAPRRKPSLDAHEIIATHESATGKAERIAKREAKAKDQQSYASLLKEVVVLRSIAALAINANVLGLKDMLLVLGGKTS